MKHKGDIDLDNNDLLNVGTIDAALSALNQVDLTGLASGDFLYWNGTNWIPQTASSVASLDDLSDVTLTSPVAGHGLWYDGVKFINRVGYADELEMSSTDPTNVETKILTNSSNIATNASDISNQATLFNNHITSIANHTDVTLTSPVSGNVMFYNGTAWVNFTLDADDIDDTSTTHKFVTAADVTKLGHITVTQAVDLDTMESDISTNASNISTNTSNISTNSSGITANANALTTHEASVGTHTDVTITSAASGEVLEYNGSAWVNTTRELNDASDVTLTSPANTERLGYNGSAWVNVTNNLNDLANVDAGSTDHMGIYYNSTSGDWEAGTGVIDMENSTAASVGSYARGATTLQLATGQTLTAGNLVVNPTGSGLSNADANSSDTGRLLSIVSTTTDGTKQVIYGIVKVNTSLTTDKAGDPVYVSETAGAVTTTAPTTSGAFVRIVGHVVDPSRDVILFNPSNDWIELE